MTSPAVELALLIDELLRDIHTRERYVEERPNRPRKTKVHDLHHGALLTQLRTAVQSHGSSGAADGTGTRTGPASRPPLRHDALELLTEITTGAADLRQQLRHASGKGAGARGTTVADLRALVGLLGNNADLDREVLHQVRSWVSASRVLLTHDSPIVTLRDSCCPYCGADLRARADGTSDVWCSQQVTVRWCEVESRIQRHRLEPTECTDENGHRHTWPRTSWLMLLDRMEQPA
jgi:hypothetical protein